MQCEALDLEGGGPILRMSKIVYLSRINYIPEDLNFELNIALYDAETWTRRKVDKNGTGHVLRRNCFVNTILKRR
jgi:hypothetical protein